MSPLSIVMSLIMIAVGCVMVPRLPADTMRLCRPMVILLTSIAIMIAGSPLSALVMFSAFCWAIVYCNLCGDSAKTHRVENHDR